MMKFFCFILCLVGASLNACNARGEAPPGESSIAAPPRGPHTGLVEFAQPPHFAAESEAVNVHFSDDAMDWEISCESPVRHNRVSHDPGRPAKPHKEHPGDISRANDPAPRYTMPDCRRAGYPHEVAPWAKCSVTEHYSAWYVGGDTAWVLPRKRRPKTAEEGTWGLDYDGLLHPRRVWLAWSQGRNQGGTGAYDTEGEPAVISRIKELKHK